MTAGRRFGRLERLRPRTGSALLPLQIRGGLVERNLFMRLCLSDQALARMRSYEEKKITKPSARSKLKGG
jgi:hypothetical protein